MSDRVIPNNVWVEIVSGVRILQRTGQNIPMEVRADPAAAERECVQIRAERDAALTLLRQVLREMATPTDRHPLDTIVAIRARIHESHLLDDEGQQHA